jgi:Ser/Thr protein kinase RdoA (MazF antagonist)
LERRARAALAIDEDGSKVRARLKDRLAAVIDGDSARAGAALFDLALVVAANGGEPEEEVRQAAMAFTKRFLAAERAAATDGTTISSEFEQLDERVE